MEPPVDPVVSSRVISQLNGCVQNSSIILALIGWQQEICDEPITDLTRPWQGLAVPTTHRLHYTLHVRHRFHVAGSGPKGLYNIRVLRPLKSGRLCDRTLHENNNLLGREQVKMDLCHYSLQGYQCTAIATVDQILIRTAVTVLLLLKQPIGYFISDC